MLNHGIQIRHWDSNHWVIRIPTAIKSHLHQFHPRNSALRRWGYSSWSPVLAAACREGLRPKLRGIFGTFASIPFLEVILVPRMLKVRARLVFPYSVVVLVVVTVIPGREVILLISCAYIHIHIHIHIQNT